MSKAIGAYHPGGSEPANENHPPQGDDTQIESGGKMMTTNELLDAIDPTPKIDGMALLLMRHAAKGARTRRRHADAQPKPMAVHR